MRAARSIYALATGNTDVHALAWAGAPAHGSLLALTHSRFSDDFCDGYGGPDSLGGYGGYDDSGSEDEEEEGARWPSTARHTADHFRHQWHADHDALIRYSFGDSEAPALPAKLTSGSISREARGARGR